MNQYEDLLQWFTKVSNVIVIFMYEHEKDEFVDQLEDMNYCSPFCKFLIVPRPEVGWNFYKIGEYLNKNVYSDIHSSSTRSIDEILQESNSIFDVEKKMNLAILRSLDGLNTRLKTIQQFEKLDSLWKKYVKLAKEDTRAKPTGSKSIQDIKSEIRNKKAQIDLVTKMLLDGYSIEFLDGTNSWIYKKWLTNILKRMNELISDAKVVILSVLGVQSSFKSTLLNIMFGVSFKTGLGKCTNGIHATLLTLDSGMQKILNYTHILVLDVEGLQSTEKREENNANDFTHQDNELATAVVCMSDLCLINFRGENSAMHIHVTNLIEKEYLRISNDFNTEVMRLENQALAKIYEGDTEFNLQEFLDTKLAVTKQQLIDKFGGFLDFGKHVDMQEGSKEQYKLRLEMTMENVRDEQTIRLKRRIEMKKLETELELKNNKFTDAFIKGCKEKVDTV
ncbi:hypothetical protein Ciccas_014115, partial [Cichlidogyrus casuarinus]